MKRALAILALFLATSSAARAATFVVTSSDSPGEGLNDPTPVSPVGGNTGTTRGQQRLIVLQRAAAIWGEVLQSSLTIRVDAKFDPMPCMQNSASLGFAGPTGLFGSFVGAPLANTWYPSALGDAVAGMDLGPTKSDIQAMFNSDIDTGCFLGAPQGWYYGLDGVVPQGQQQLLLTALHELAHGLGVSLSTDLNTGAKLQNFDDVYTRHVEDHTTGKLFPAMTDAERAAALKRTGELHWTGPRVRQRSELLSAGKTGDHVHLYAPAMVQPSSTGSHFDTTLTPDELMEPFLKPTSIRDLTIAMFSDMGWTLLADAPSPTPTGTPTLPPSPTPSRTLTATPTPTVPPSSPTATSQPTATLAPGTPTPTVVVTATSVPVLRGDANCDTRRSVADLLAVVDGIGRGTPCLGADADADGDIDAGDLERTLELLFG